MPAPADEDGRLSYVLDHIDRAHDGLRDEMRHAVGLGVLDAVKTLSKDDELLDRFASTLFDHLARHAGNASSQWVGKRILTALIAAIATACIIWLVKSGALR